MLMKPTHMDERIPWVRLSSLCKVLSFHLNFYCFGGCFMKTRSKVKRTLKVVNLHLNFPIYVNFRWRINWSLLSTAIVVIKNLNFNLGSSSSIRSRERKKPLEVSMSGVKKEKNLLYVLCKFSAKLKPLPVHKFRYLPKHLKIRSSKNRGRFWHFVLNTG